MVFVLLDSIRSRLGRVSHGFPILGCVLGAVLALPLAAQADERGSNFLFVISDDHRWDAMGVVQREQGERARFPWFQSPAMDRLAAEGVRFRKAFVVHSLCSPGRAAFLTGLIIM